MTALRIERAGDGRMCVSGDIDTRNAGSALKHGDALISAGVESEVDLAGLGSTDSVTLAVLLAWSARARRAGAGIHFTHMPAHLRALAHLSDVEGLLGLDQSA